MHKRFRVLDTGVLEGRLNIAIGQAIVEAQHAGEVPDTLRFGTQDPVDYEELADFDEDDYGEASDARRARDGRPPSKWLRSLYAEELRLWLPEIDVPETGVSGMTVWTHLTRDHRFDAKRIEGLTDQELAKLHSAAHYGY